MFFLSLGKRKRERRQKKHPCAIVSQHLLPLKTVSVGANGQEAGDSPQFVTDSYGLSAQLQTAHLVAWQVWGYSLHMGEKRVLISHVWW